MHPLTQPSLASAAFKADPHPFYAALRDEAPVYRAQLSTRDARWLITRYDDVARLLKDQRLIKNRFTAQRNSPDLPQPWVPGILRPLASNMLDMDQPDHTRLRSLVHKAFTPRLIERLRGRVTELAQQLLDRAASRGSMDLIRDYALPIPVTIIAEMLAIPPADGAKFQRWSQTIVSISSESDVLRVLPSIWQFLRYLRAQFRRRRAALGDDLMSALLQAEDGGERLSEDELLAMVFLLLIAGHETTVNLIASGTLALLENPEQLARLRQDPALMPKAIEELLRFTSPVDVATERFAAEDIELHGVTIRRGEQVLAVIGAANRDPRQFTDPDSLRPRPRPQPPPGVWPGHPLLPGRAAGTAGGPDCSRPPFGAAADAAPRPAGPDACLAKIAVCAWPSGAAGRLELRHGHHSAILQQQSRHRPVLFASYRSQAWMLKR